jgi:hypothetical protein
MSESTKNVRYHVHGSLQFFSNLSHFNPFSKLTLPLQDRLQYIFQFTPSPGCIKVRAFWDVTPCILIGVHWSFEGTYCLHFQGRRLRQEFCTKCSRLSRYLASCPKSSYAYIRTCRKKFYEITASFFGFTYLTMHQPFPPTILLMIQEIFLSL